MTVADCVFTEPCRSHAGQGQEALDFRKKLLVHEQQATVCYATLSRKSVLYHHLPFSGQKCDKAHMESDEFQVVLDVIRRNVAVAAESTGIGLKPLAKSGGMGETVIRDLVKAHNKDVQLATLAKIARITKTPLVELIRMPGAADEVSLRSLERALNDAMPGLPEDEGRRVEYLMSTVRRVLQLPAGLRDNPGNDDSSDGGDPAEGVPVPRPTK